MARSGAAVTLVLAACVVGCSGSGGGSASVTLREVGPTDSPAPATSPIGSSSPTEVQTGDLAPVQSGFPGPEAFCGPHGRIAYSSRDGEGRLDVALRDVPPSTSLELDWRNNDIRGYAIGYVTTTAHGTVGTAGVVFYRAPETRGIGVLLATESDDHVVVGSFAPC